MGNGVDVESTSVAPWQVSLQHSGSIYTNQPKYQVHGMFTCHPDWNSNKMDYDYSIITLASEVDVTNPDLAVIPIAAKEYPGGMAAQITGWGLTNSHLHQLPTQLQLADTFLVSAT